MKYATQHPAVVEHQLRWSDFNPDEQNKLIEAIKTNDGSRLREEVFDVEMPCFFVIQFPLNLVQPQAGAEQLGTMQLLIEPRASSNNAGLQEPEANSSSAASD